MSQGSSNFLVIAVGIGAAVAGYYLSGHAGPGDQMSDRSGMQPRVITGVSDIATSLANAVARVTGMRLDPSATSPIEDRRGENPAGGNLADQLGPPSNGQWGAPQDEGDGGDFRQAGGPPQGGAEGRDPPEVDPSQAHGRRLGCWDSRRHRPVPLSYCQQSGGAYAQGGDYAQGPQRDGRRTTPPVQGSVWCSGRARGHVWRDDPNCPRAPSGRFRKSDWGER